MGGGEHAEQRSVIHSTISSNLVSTVVRNLEVRTASDYGLLRDVHHFCRHCWSFLSVFWVLGKGTKDIRRNKRVSHFIVADLGYAAK